MGLKIFARGKEKENMEINKDSWYFCLSNLVSVGAIFPRKGSMENNRFRGENHEFHWDFLS